MTNATVVTEAPFSLMTRHGPYIVATFAERDAPSRFLTIVEEDGEVVAVASSASRVDALVRHFRALVETEEPSPLGWAIAGS